MKTSKLKVTGAILAGGKSRRMGRNKALLPLGGKPVVQRLVVQFEEMFEETMLIANDPELYQVYSSKIVPDIFPGKGPLAGLHAALNGAKNDWVFLTACDTAFVQTEVVMGMAELRKGTDAVLAETEDGLQPLNAFYSRRCLPFIENRLRTGKFKMISFHSDVKIRIVQPLELPQWDPDTRTFWNMNTPEDYEEALARFQAAPDTKPEVVEN